VRLVLIHHALWVEEGREDGATVKHAMPGPLLKIRTYLLEAFKFVGVVGRVERNLGHAAAVGESVFD